MRLCRELKRGFDIAAPLRLDMQATQTEETRVVTIRHGLECAFRLHSLSRELGRLRGEEKDQGLVRQALLRFGGGFLCEPQIPRPCRDHPARERRIALVTPAPPLAERHER